MKVFISSLITGMEAERAAARRAIEMLGHQAVMAEDFPASASSPRVACLSGVREADVIVLILASRYGTKQASGLSATHEEFQEAKGRKPVLTFVQKDADPEPDQKALIGEASGWEPGVFWKHFSSPDELTDRVAGALHAQVLSSAVAPLDPSELSSRARSLLPELRRDVSGSIFTLALAAGPTQAVLRPAEIEAAQLATALQQRVLFGSSPPFDLTSGTNTRIEDGALVVSQDGRYGEDREVRLWDTGDIRIQLPAARPSEGIGFPSVIQEEIAARLETSIGLMAWLLGHVDPTERLTHVVLAARVAGSAAYGWRTRAEQAASPNSGSISMFGQEEERGVPVMLTPPHMVRQALTMNTPRLVEDLTVLLRRQWQR